MDFNLTADHRIFSDSLTRFLKEKHGIDQRNSVAYNPPYYDPKKWRGLAELGVFTALASKNVGGFGGSGADVSVIFQVLGRELVCEPILPVLMASRLLAAAGQNQNELLDGSLHYAVAISEPDAPYSLKDVVLTANEKNQLSGRKSAVYGAHCADCILVAARADNQLNLYRVLAHDIEIVPYGMIDGGGAGEILLDEAPAELLLEKAENTFQDALDAGVVALCSEAVGVMEIAYEMTVKYLKQRKQFGQTIGSFQVLQHRAVDMLTEIEQSRSITMKAAAELGSANASRFASMAKNMIGRSGRHISEEAIQMHGGIAMTWEYAVSHYAKRLIMIDHQLGDTDYHLNRIMDDLNPR